MNVKDGAITKKQDLQLNSVLFCKMCFLFSVKNASYCVKEKGLSFGTGYL